MQRNKCTKNSSPENLGNGHQIMTKKKISPVRNPREAHVTKTKGQNKIQIISNQNSKACMDGKLPNRIKANLAYQTPEQK
jgi:hypothetical protein